MYAWEQPRPIVALTMLNDHFPDPKVRGYASLCLERMRDETLSQYILQLTQTLKHEPFHDSGLGKYIQAKERASRNGSTVVDISIPPPSFKPVSLFFLRFPLSKTPKQVFFNPINIFDTFTHYLLFFLIYFFRLTSKFIFTARFLLRRAVRNTRLLGHQLFWALKAEMHDPLVSDRYGVLLDMYRRNCGAHRGELGHQLFLMRQLQNCSDIVKRK